MDITLDLSTIIELTDEQFYKLASAHEHLKLERNATGEIVIMTPTGGETGNRNTDLTYQLQSWCRKYPELGLAFDSSTMFVLPNGAKRSPDVAWVKRDRWNALTAEQRVSFPPLCPDFVIELRSPSDSLSSLQAKMREYREQGALLGWLIDPKTKLVEVYRAREKTEVLSHFSALNGEDVLPGFVLDLRLIWE